MYVIPVMVSLCTYVGPTFLLKCWLKVVTRCNHYVMIIIVVLCRQLTAELDELMEWLMTDVIADDVTSADAALRELDDKCEKLGESSDLDT